MKKSALLTFAIFATIFVALTHQAISFDWMKPFKSPKRDVHTLLVCANYTKHRILAELVQLETRQPILLLPTQPGGKIFFMPYKKDAIEIEDAKFTNFVKFTNPERILIIHDGTQLTQSFIDRIDPYQTKIVVNNKNMELTAIAVGRIMDLTDLADDFAKINRDIESGKFYRTGSTVSQPGPASATQPATATMQGTTVTLPPPPPPPPTPAQPVIVPETESVPQK